MDCPLDSRVARMGLPALPRRQRSLLGAEAEAPKVEGWPMECPPESTVARTRLRKLGGRACRAGLWLTLCVAPWACGDPSGSSPGMEDADAGGIPDTGDPDVGGVPCPTGDREDGVCPPAAPVLAADCPTQVGPEGVCEPAPRMSSCPDAPNGICATAPPVLADWECPEGWDAVDRVDEGVPAFRTCMAPSVPETCAEGTWPRPGTARCAAVGPACSDEFAPESALRDAAPGFAGVVRYVEAGAAGDGSRGAPFGALDDAVTASSPGDVIAVRGDVGGDVSLDGVALVGTCAADWVGALSLTGGGLAVQVEIRGAVTVGEGGLRDVVVVGAAGVGVRVEGMATLSNVVVADTTAVDGDGWGVFVDGGTLIASGLTLWRNTNIGLRVVGGRAELDRIIVADTRPISAAPFRGRGLQAEQGGMLVARSAVVVRNRNSALLAADAGSLLEIEDGFVAQTRGNEGTDTFGDGLTAFDGAEVHLTRTHLDNNRNSGLTVVGAGTSVTLEQVVISDTQVGAVNNVGTGIYMEAGALVTARQTVVLRSAETGVSAFGAGARIDAEDVVVASTRPDGAGAFGRGMGLQDGAEAVLARARFVGNTESGVYVSGASTLSATDVDVRGTRPDPSSGEFGYGLNATAGATVTLERCHIADNTAAGVLSGVAGTQVSMTDCTVSDTLPNQAGESTGLTVQMGARLDVERVALVGNAGVAVAVLQGVATLSGRDLLIENTVPRGDQRGGRGMEVALGGRVELSRVELRDNRELGIFAQGSGSAVVLSDLLVVNTGTSLADGLGGRALNAQDGARIEVERFRAEGGHDAGVFAGAATLNLTDVVIVGTDTDDQGLFGRAVVLQSGGIAVMRRAVISDNAEVGLFVTGAGTTLTLTDAIVRDTRPDGQGDWGRGIGVQDGAHATLERVLIAGNRDVGLFVHGEGAAVDATDLEVRDGLPQESDGDFGRGIGVQAGARFSGSRVLIADNRQVGLLAVSDGTVVDVEDLQVVATAQLACVGDCPQIPGGSGIAVLGADLTLRRFAVRGSELAGLQLGPTGLFTAEDGLITQNRIGLNLQDETLDIGASFIRVRVRDNETDRDLEKHPVPTVTQTLAALRDAE